MRSVVSERERGGEVGAQTDGHTVLVQHCKWVAKQAANLWKVRCACSAVIGGAIALTGPLSHPTMHVQSPAGRGGRAGTPRPKIMAETWEDGFYSMAVRRSSVCSHELGLITTQAGPHSFHSVGHWRSLNRLLFLTSSPLFPLMSKASSFLLFCLSVSGTLCVGNFSITKLIKLIRTTERRCLQATNAKTESAPQQPTLLETLRKCEK